jgi:hypothetical protein
MNPARNTVRIAIAVVLTLGAISCAGTRGMRSSTPNIQGTWELAWPAMDPQFRELKLITPTHFTWVTYDTDSHTAVTCGGGRYFLVGDSYNEHIEFALGPVSSLVGTLQVFRVTVTGDTLTQTGELTNGRMIHERWVRAPNSSARALSHAGAPSRTSN